MAARFFGSLSVAAEDFDSAHRKCSISSPDSAASAMLRFLGEWNCSQSRSRAKASTRARISPTVVVASVIGVMMPTVPLKLLRCKIPRDDTVGTLPALVAACRTDALGHPPTQIPNGPRHSSPTPQRRRFAYEGRRGAGPAPVAAAVPPHVNLGS